MPETKIISNQTAEFKSEIESALAAGWIPDEFYGPNGAYAQEWRKLAT